MSGVEVTHREYSSDGLIEDDCSPAPLPILLDWIAAAEARQTSHGDVREPGAMAVATVDDQGHPDVRTVLLRSLDARGAAFFTHTNSAKGRQLAARPAIAATLTWPAIFRAIRLRGYAVPLPGDEVTAYFSSRPWGSRIGAHASAQSEPVSGRQALETAYAEAAARFPDTGSGEDVPVPEQWGGYLIVPELVELWAGRRSRMHDRLVYTRTRPATEPTARLDDSRLWRLARLQP